MEEPKHVLKILQETKKAVKEEDVIELKRLSNKTIHSASIHQDTDSIMIAVILYSLSKILERTNYRSYPGWEKFFKSFMKHIDQAENAINQKRNDVDDHQG